VRIVEDRAARGAELLPAGQALVDARPFVLASLALNLRDATYLAAVDTANLAVGPAHLLDVVEAIIVSLEFARYIYELHGLGFLLRHIITVSTITAMMGNKNVNSMKQDYINNGSVSSA
jgi:hypothetical protein